MNNSLLRHWRGNFLTGLAVVLPVVISVGVIIWLFGTVANFTDLLLFFLPRALTHQDHGNGPMYWYWSAIAFLLAIVLVSIAGLSARHYLGKQLIAWMDGMLFRVPLLNKVYGAIKQVNEAFTVGNRSAFKTVVIVEFPRAGVYSLGFLTGDQHVEVQSKIQEKLVSVFIPTTPNPTSGWLILIPERDVTRLEMSVADAIKLIISLGAVVPEYPPRVGVAASDGCRSSSSTP